jgi:PEP-CTERM motif
MVNVRNNERTSPVSAGTHNRSSKAAKLAQAAALAAVLVPLGSVAAEATSIDHTFSGEAANQNYDFHSFGGNYEFELFFENPSGPEFVVRVTDNITTQDALTEDGRLNNPEVQGDICVPIADGLDTCVDFAVTRVISDQQGNPVEIPLLQGDDTFTGSYSVTIRWDAITDFDFPNDPGNRIRIIHNKGSVPGDAFDTDITTEGSYQGSLLLQSFDDPAIGGRDDNFQSLMVAQRPNAVPEPATLFLVTTGVSGLLYRRRRKG